MVREWPLVGRRHELERVAHVVADPDVAGVVLSGPAGVGKTRLAAECLRVAETIGFATARAVASRAAATIPLGALAPLLPAMSGRPTDDVLGAAARSLAARGGDRPLVLGIDDAHALDEPSASLVYQLASNKEVFVVATIRSGETVPDPITRLWKDGLAVQIEVPSLSRSEVEHLVTTVLDGPVEGITLRDLWDASQGNLLFLREVVLGAIESEALSDVGGVWRLQGRLATSARLAELVESRLAGLAEAERDALEIVARGEPLGYQLLDRMAGAEPLRTLEAKGLIAARVEGMRNSLALAHPLYGEVIRTTMSPLRARGVNRGLADAVEELGARRREDTLRVAAWRLDGGGPAQVGLMLRAARQARFLFDFPLAERLATVAWEGDDPEAGQVLAEALAQQGKLSEAEVVMAALEPSVTSDRERALLSMTRCDNLFWGLQDEAAAFAVSLRTEADLTTAEWRDEVVCQRASFDFLAGRSQLALATVAEYLERPLSRALIGAAVVAGPAFAIHGRSEEALSVCDRALAAHRHLGDQMMITHPGIHLVARSLALMEAGRLAEAETNAQLGYDGSVATGAIRAQSWFALMLGRAALLQGRVRMAARWGREAAALYREVGRTGPVRWCMGLVTMAEAMAGDVEAARAAMAEGAELAATPFQLFEAEIERSRAWVLIASGELSAAKAALHHAASMAAEAGQLAVEASALHDLARTGDAAAAASRLGELATLVDGELTACRSAHAQALIADDAALLEAVGQRFEALGANLLAAEAATAAALTARRHGQRAMASTAQRRGASLAAGCDGARTPGLAIAAAEAALTGRELEIATLAASGLTSPDIASRLEVSVRTVTNHLQRAYAKLGVTRRADVPGALERLASTSAGGRD